MQICHFDSNSGIDKIILPRGIGDWLETKLLHFTSHF
jgi:hypothetical protein